MVVGMVLALALVQVLDGDVVVELDVGVGNHQY